MPPGTSPQLWSGGCQDSAPKWEFLCSWRHAAHHGSSLRPSAASLGLPNVSPVEEQPGQRPGRRLYPDRWSYSGYLRQRKPETVPCECIGGVHRTHYSRNASWRQGRRYLRVRLGASGDRLRQHRFLRGCQRRQWRRYSVRRSYLHLKPGSELHQSSGNDSGDQVLATQSCLGHRRRG